MGNNHGSLKKEATQPQHSTTNNSKDEKKIDSRTEQSGKTLVDIPDDLMRKIIPYLGLIDRSNLAVTCRRFYEAEAKAGNSKNSEIWDSVGIDEKGKKVSMYKCFFEDVDDESGRYSIMRTKRMILSLKKTTPATTNAVIQRIFRATTATKMEKLEAAMQLNDCHSESQSEED
ncbi:hypothetical protein PMAYCL1PPCAC_06278 [Pristionchus mayeri]|uniref:F-box domain-containing protein n=1 Tax=Pristionchus mayeri TaxID=1317129 RepID=A0AAN4Z7X3_9BILA|nr:hypothetical protein PMAYCL1PPCAC_06278 [Pristionchus mayeri]